MRSVVLLSGGVDSTTCLALAVREAASEDVLAISMAYGQKHSAELDHAREVAAHYGVRHEVLEIPSPVRGGDSTLIEGGAENPRGRLRRPPTRVYRRPTYHSAMASSSRWRRPSPRGVSAEFVYFGAHSEDAHRWAYPDCTPEFIGSMASAMFVGSYMKVRLLTPLQWLTKAQIVRLGTDLAAPYHLTMSCYNGTRSCLRHVSDVSVPPGGVPGERARGPDRRTRRTELWLRPSRPSAPSMGENEFYCSVLTYGEAARLIQFVEDVDDWSAGHRPRGQDPAPAERRARRTRDGPLPAQRPRPFLLGADR